MNNLSFVTKIYFMLMSVVSLNLIGANFPTGFRQQPCPSLIMHLEYLEFEKFKKLLKNPDSDVNVVYGNGESLLHATYRHGFESTGVKFFCELLKRSDLSIDQVGIANGYSLGRGFRGTVLACAVKDIIILYKNLQDDPVHFWAPHCFVRQLFCIHALLARGANPSLISDEINGQSRVALNIDVSQQLDVKIKQKLIDSLKIFADNERNLKELQKKLLQCVQEKYD